MPLFSDDRENVRMEKWDANANVEYAAQGGLEIFVVEGGFAEGGESFAEQSWLRLPVGTHLEAKVGNESALVWVKEGHLAQLDREAFATGAGK